MVEEIALQLYKVGKEPLAKQYLTDYCYNNALEAFKLAETMTDDIEERTRILFGFEESQPHKP